MYVLLPNYYLITTLPLFLLHYYCTITANGFITTSHTVPHFQRHYCLIATNTKSTSFCFVVTSTTLYLTWRCRRRTWLDHRQPRLRSAWNARPNMLVEVDVKARHETPVAEVTRTTGGVTFLPSSSQVYSTRQVVHCMGAKKNASNMQHFRAALKCLLPLALIWRAWLAVSIVYNA